MRRVLKYTLYGLLWMALAAYVAAAWRLASDHRAHRTLGKIRAEVTGLTEQLRLVEPEKVVQWVARSGVPLREAMLGTVDLLAMEQAVAAHAFVKGARAWVDYEGDITLRVAQRTPLLRLRVDGYDTYVTDDGHLFAAPPHTSAYVPVATGAYRPPFEAAFAGRIDDWQAGQQAAWQARLAALEREKYPLYQTEMENDEAARQARRLRVKQGWLERDEAFAKRAAAAQREREELRKKYRWRGQQIQQRLEAVDSRIENEKRTQKKLLSAVEDFRKLLNFVGWLERDDFWRGQVVQIVLSTAPSGGMELTLVPRQGSFVIRFGAPDQVTSKLARLRAFYAEALAREGWAEAAELDVRFAGQVIYRTKATPAEVKKVVQEAPEGA